MIEFSSYYKKYKINPDLNNPADRNGDMDGDGFTNLEEYLNEIVK